MIIGQCFATPFTEDINCYHAHKIISETVIEQIGFAESLMHVITMTATPEIIGLIKKDEIIIDEYAYNRVKKLLEYLFTQACETLENCKTIDMTIPVNGACFRHGSDIGMITGQVRMGTKIGFSGLRMKDNHTLNSFLDFINPEDLLNNAYVQIEPDDYAKIAVLNNLTYLTVRSIIQKAMKTTDFNS